MNQNINRKFLFAIHVHALTPMFKMLSEVLPNVSTDVNIYIYVCVYVRVCVCTCNYSYMPYPQPQISETPLLKLGDGWMITSHNLCGGHYLPGPNSTYGLADLITINKKKPKISQWPFISHVTWTIISPPKLVALLLFVGATSDNIILNQLIKIKKHWFWADM